MTLLTSLIDNKLVIASHNDGKIQEIRDLFKSEKISILTSNDFLLKEPVENGKTFEENALIKSKYTSINSGLVSVSDDSGICFDALDGKPGIHSARIAGENKDFIKAMKKINLKIKNYENKTCKFVCALSMCWPNGQNITVRGEVFGCFVWPPRGKLGFGYDPIFIPKGYNETFGEMEPNKKNSISHRQVAFKKLVKKLRSFF